MTPAEESSSCRRFVHPSAIDSMSFWKLSVGKYVPPKKGFRSGVRKTVIGQPPRPVIASTALM